MSSSQNKYVLSLNMDTKKCATQSYTIASITKQLFLRHPFMYRRQVHQHQGPYLEFIHRSTYSFISITRLSGYKRPFKVYLSAQTLNIFVVIIKATKNPTKIEFKNNTTNYFSTLFLISKCL